jgi:outer membrane protein OmpU
MNKLQKVGLTALATSLVATSAYAGEMSVSGSASLSYTGLSSASGTNPWAMGNSVKFSGGGELDNGTTFTAYFELDNDVMDDYNLTFGLPGDMGTVKFIGDSGLAGGLSTVNNIVPTAYTPVFETTDADDNGVATSTLATNANWGYTYSTGGLTASAAYNPKPGAAENSATHFGVSYDVQGMDGLTIVAGTGSDGEENDIETLGASYTMGNVTVGYQRTEITLASGSGNDETGTHVGASLAINENLSVSVGRQETDFATGTSDEENTGYSASYTMGGMTIGYAFNEAKNVAGNAANADIEASILNLSFAF